MLFLVKKNAGFFLSSKTKYFSKRASGHPLVCPCRGDEPRGTGPENYPSNDGKTPSFAAMLIPVKNMGFFPSKTKVQSPWVHKDCVAAQSDDKDVKFPHQMTGKPRHLRLC